MKPVHKQLIKIREYWINSNNPNKQDMIDIFTAYIDHLEYERNLENETFDDADFDIESSGLREARS